MIQRVGQMIEGKIDNELNLAQTGGVRRAKKYPPYKRIP